MNKLKLLLLLTIIITPVLYSCQTSDDDKYSLAIATINVIDGNDYYFLTDKGNKILPGDTTALHNYKVIPGQRVYVYFDEMDEKVPGYDYNARIRYIENILTKGIIPMTEENQESIGDDPINISYIWFGGDHLNIEFHFQGTANSSTPHIVNLVKEDITIPLEDGNEETEEEDDKYVNLELRHNAMGDTGSERLVSIVSFKKPFTTDPTKKGLKIRVKTIYDGIKYYTIDLNSEELNRALENIANSAIRVD
ncbi:NigD-like protein [Bacteroides sp. 224]|uniref:NigD-like protein n=1 Tax=Bacteroides sp. 224 TaxID=2302936 RepID=UPI0013D26DF8|nr:NigD-like protein [Bacteroides sp. 224]NDV66228.1 hypothetical protein [Bacteroides sp. 224]